MNAQEQALKLVRGSYQRNLILGYETLGGSSLRGKAKTYIGRYQESTRNLIARLKSNNVIYKIELGPRGGWYSAKLSFPMTFEDWSKSSFCGKLYPCTGIFGTQYQSYLERF